MFTLKRSTTLQGVIISLLSVPLAANAAELITTTAQSATAQSSTTGTDEVAVNAELGGTASDSSGNVLEGVVVKVGDLTATTDSEGKYKITGLAFGEYTVSATKVGYFFSSTQVTLSVTNPMPMLNLKSSDIGNLAQLAIGAHSCDNNANQILLVDNNGQTLKSIDSSLTGKGIDVVTTDWDLNKTVDFLVASKLFEGNDAIVFDTAGNKLASLPVSTLNKGVRIVFGHFADGMAAVVVNQAEDNKLYFYPKDKAPFSLDILKNAADVNIVAADLNNDGIDEIIVLSAKQINGTNVLVLDSKGKALASLLLTLNGESATTNLPGLVGTTFVDQGKTVFAVANTEGTDHQVALYSFGEDFKATFMSNFKPFDAETTPATDACNMGDGLLLSSGLQNDKPVMWISKNGSNEVSTFDTQGNLIQTVPLSESNQSITSISGTNIDLNLPVLTSLPPPGVILKDVAVAGTPEQPLEVADREVDGNVYFSNVVITNITIKITAKVTFGEGVRFKQVKDIPKGAKLTHILRKIQKATKRAKHDAPAVNLNQSITVGSATILQQLQTLLQIYQLRLQQEAATGHVIVESGNKRHLYKPVNVKQNDGSKSRGLHVHFNGTISLVTEDDQEVEMVQTMEDIDGFADTLPANNLGGLEAADSGQMTALPADGATDSLYTGIPESASTEANAAEPEGLQPADSPVLPAGNKALRVFVFKDKHGKKRKQHVHPYLAVPSFLNQELSFDLEGVLTFKFNGKVLRGVLDYRVVRGVSTRKATPDIQSLGNGKFVIVFPNGLKQFIFTQ